MKRLLTSVEAAALLGVSRQTLYSYVSRGLLRAQAGPDAQGKRYDRHEVERLLHSASSGRKPREAARGTLSFGLPVMESALTLIHDGELWYRGQSATKLAQHATLEEVACLLWGCGAETPFVDIHLPPMPALHTTNLPVLEQAMPDFMTVVAVLPLLDNDASDIELLKHAAMLTRTMATALLREPASTQALHLQCARHWRVEGAATERIRAALVLCADHELNVSSFSARCVASSGASLHAVIISAVAALSGPRHGMASEAVEALLDNPDDLTTLVARYADAGKSVPGFGHRLYPHGDPRARCMLEGLPLNEREIGLCESVAQHYGLQPNIDFALVVLRRRLALPRSATAIIFCLGRVVGWLAHALEQRKNGNLIRPRAKYIGIPPPVGTTAHQGRLIRNGKPVRHED